MFGRRRNTMVVVAQDPVLGDDLDQAVPGTADEDPTYRASGRAEKRTRRRDRLSPKVAGARERVVPAVSRARGRVVPVVAGARERVVPAVAGARETLVDTLAPAVAGALTTAVTAVREGKPNPSEAARRSAAALAALRGELPRRQRRWPIALVSLLVGAVAGAVAGIMSRRAAAPSEPSYIPATPAPPPRSTPAQPVSEPNVTPSVVNLPDEPAGTQSDLGWPEQAGEPFASSDQDAVLAMDEVDLTLAEDSSETHKPTA